MFVVVNLCWCVCGVVCMHICDFFNVVVDVIKHVCVLNNELCDDMVMMSVIVLLYVVDCVVFVCVQVLVVVIFVCVV